MTLRIATPHQSMRLILPMMKMRKPPSPTMTTKVATAPSAARQTIDSVVAEMEKIHKVNGNNIK